MCQNQNDDKRSLFGATVVLIRRRTTWWELAGRWAILPAALTALIVTLIQPRPAAVVESETAAANRFNEVIGLATAAGAPAVTVDFPVTDAQVLSWDVSRSPNISTVQLNAGIVSDRSVAHLANLRGLQHLRLVASPVGDAAMGALADHPQLRILNLPDGRVTPDGLCRLSASKTLRTLRLGSTNLDNDACEAIAQIRTLRMIHLIGVPVTDDGLRQLAGLPRLRTLYLDGAAVTDEGYRWLYEHRPNLHVHVDQMHGPGDPKAHEHSHR